MSHERTHFLRIVALAVLALALGDEAPEAHAVDCNAHTDVVFYTNDTGGRLVGELKKFPSCTDYYVSVTPRTAAGVEGWPNGNPVPGIHAAGANFHALAEIRLTPWSKYVSDGHTWYEAGLRVRELMGLAGYDPAKDTWALNEVGEPASQALGADVIKGIGTARQNVRDFIRGLDTGDGTPMLGLVFAAEPVQVAEDLSEYEADLEGWYADSAFWADMSIYVRFWAQETFADARTWGVAGRTLGERTAFLNDYFMHGLRLATDRGDATSAARTFFERAYTPVGNAAMLRPPPELTGIGFGYTQLPLNTMLNFVSTQTYALRSSIGNRFGFSDFRDGATLADVVAVEDRVAAAIRDSETDPIGACGTDLQWCDSAVAGAAFNGVWRELGTPTPPTVVPHVEGPLGANGWYTGDVTVTWSVEDPESPISSASGCDETVISEDTAVVTLTCTATSFGGTTALDVTVMRDATPPAVACEPTPSMLWPPNHRLVPVAVAVTIDDETSGPGAFELRETSSSDHGAGSDIRGFEIGEPDVEGFLRAERRPASDGRSYVLTYVAHDAAGNAAECVARVVVRRDQGE